MYNSAKGRELEAKLMTGQPAVSIPCFVVEGDAQATPSGLDRASLWLELAEVEAEIRHCAQALQDVRADLEPPPLSAIGHIAAALLDGLAQPFRRGRGIGGGMPLR